MRNALWLPIGALSALAAIEALAACDDTPALPVTPYEAGPGTDGGVDALGQGDALAGPQPTADVQIVAIADWEGQLDPLQETDQDGLPQSYGGLGVLSAYFAKARANTPNTLVVTTGDSIGATPALSSALDDGPPIAAMGFLGVIATTFGGRDLAHGTDFLAAKMKASDFQWVTSNLTNAVSALGPRASTPLVLVDVGAADPKVRVALLGITNPDTTSLVAPDALGTMTVSDPIASANAAAAAARAAGAHVVVALTGLGATGTDVLGGTTGPLVDFAGAVRGVDVVLGGHTDRVVQQKIGSTVVLENRRRGRSFATVAIHVDAGRVTTATGTVLDAVDVATAKLTDPANQCGGAAQPACRCAGSLPPATDLPCPTDFICDLSSGACTQQAVPPDPAAATLLASFAAPLAVKLDGTTGKIASLFPRDGAAELTAEAALGDLVADAMLDAYKSSGAQIAFTTGAILATPLPSPYAPRDRSLHRPAPNYQQTPPFDLVLGDPYTVLPTTTACVVRRISGKVLWQVLEAAVAREPLASSAFLQVAGVSFVYSLGGAVGARVQSVTLVEGAKDIPRDDETSYTIVTDEAVSAGANAFAMLAESVPTPPRDVLAYVLRTYLAKIGAAGPIDTPTGGRITQVP